MSNEYIVFLMSSLTLIVSLLVFMLKVCFKSKCSDVSCCWGMFKVHRNTIEESQNVSTNNIEMPSSVSPLSKV